MFAETFRNYTRARSDNLYVLVVLLSTVQRFLRTLKKGHKPETFLFFLKKYLTLFDFFFFLPNITLSTFGARVSRIPDGFSANNVWSVCELVHNIVFESCRVARTYVGFFDWLVCWLVCD